MKFGKEFASQIVPEWKEAYVNYSSLKKWVKQIQSSAQRNRVAPPQSPYRAFSGLLRRKSMARSAESDVENPPIKVRRNETAEVYETVFLVAEEGGGGVDESELKYFRKLDEEFNKVERFYVEKVEEVITEAEMLNKQMDALIAFRVRVERPLDGGFDHMAEATGLAADVAVSVAAISSSTPSSARAHRKAQMEVIEEGHGQADETDEANEIVDFGIHDQELQQKATRMSPLGVLSHATIDNASVLFFPFNILYRSSRFFFLASVFHCIFAPLYKVTFPNFFLADQLTSQVQAFRSLEFYICYYGWGDFKLRQNSCKSSDVYNTFFFIVAVIPYWSRLLQCLRRLFEEKDPMQGLNGIKYLSTIIAVSMRTAYSLNNGAVWMILAWATSIVSAVYSLYWDLVVDWGLLQRNSKNKWLRDKLMIPNKGVYFVAMVLNVLLKFAWLQTVLNFQVLVMHRQLFLTVVASLEIIRRGIWNFFRLENEHLNNVGKFRAFKSVPLPFIYDEDDKEQ